MKKTQDLERQDKSGKQTWYPFHSSSQMAACLQRRLRVFVVIIMLSIDENTVTPVVSAQVPMQCLNFFNLTEAKNGNGVIITTVPETLCDRSSEKNSWYSFKYPSLNGFFWTTVDIADSTKATSCPNQTSPLHPCNIYETITSTFCFKQFVAHSVNITHCGLRYVYQLPLFRCKKSKTGFLFRRNNMDPSNTTCNHTVKTDLYIGRCDCAK